MFLTFWTNVKQSKNEHNTSIIEYCKTTPTQNTFVKNSSGSTNKLISPNNTILSNNELNVLSFAHPVAKNGQQLPFLGFSFLALLLHSIADQNI